MTGNCKIPQIEQFWVTTRSRKVGCWNEDQKVKTMQRKAAKNDDEAQMWKSWLWEGTATVNRWKWKLEDGDLNVTECQQRDVYIQCIYIYISNLEYP